MPRRFTPARNDKKVLVTSPFYNRPVFFPRAIGILTSFAMLLRQRCGAALHIITFVAATYNCRVVTVARTILSQISRY